MKMEQTECSERSAYKIQTPENYLEENIQKLPLLRACVHAAILPKFSDVLQYTTSAPVQ
jgi:hypothetical protein